MFPFICAKAKCGFGGIAEEKAVGKTAAHDMVRSEEGQRERGAYIHSLGFPLQFRPAALFQPRGRPRARSLHPS